MKDQGLNEFLNSLRTPKPDELSLAKWKSAVHKELRQGPPHSRRRWIELTAAVLIGVLVGALAFGHKAQEEYSAENATIEFVVTKRN